jgi:hypothetical protein
MLRGVAGRCPDCDDERILLPVDDDCFEFCCSDCDAAVLMVEVLLAGTPGLSEGAGLTGRRAS